MTKFSVGDRVQLSDDGIDGYGSQWEGVTLVVDFVSTSTDDHPGYDASANGEGLYDLKREDDGSDFPGSLYDREIERV